MGRPTKFNQKKANAICIGIMQCKSLRKIAKENELTLQTIFNWLYHYPDFFDHYTRARDVQAQMFADDIRPISDEKPMITTVFTDKDGNTTERTQLDNAGIQRNRLRVDTRKWIAARLLPKKYGDRVSVETEGNLKVEPSERLTELLTLGAERARKTSDAGGAS